MYLQLEIFGTLSPRISVNNRNTFLVPGPVIIETYVKLFFGSVKSYVDRNELFGIVTTHFGNKLSP